jgi:hypothetical protein
VQSRQHRSTQTYLAQVIDIVNAHADVFSGDDSIDSIHLLDDFHSAGRISGSKRIPLAQLSVGESHTIEGQRLDVNESLTRYQRELRSRPQSNGYSQRAFAAFLAMADLCAPVSLAARAGPPLVPPRWPH